MFYEKHVLLDIFEQQTENWHFHEKSPHKVPYLPLIAVRPYIPSILQYKTHFSRQLNCWSLRCSWSIACRRYSNYIFILHLTLGFNILRKDNCKPRRETFNFWDLVHLILEILRHSPSESASSSPSCLQNSCICRRYACLSSSDGAGSTLRGFLGRLCDKPTPTVPSTCNSNLTSLCAPVMKNILIDWLTDWWIDWV